MMMMMLWGAAELLTRATQSYFFCSDAAGTRLCFALGLRRGEQTTTSRSGFCQVTFRNKHWKLGTV